MRKLLLYFLLIALQNNRITFQMGGSGILNGFRTNLLTTLYVLMGVGGGGVVSLLFNSLFSAFVLI